MSVNTQATNATEYMPIKINHQSSGVTSSGVKNDTITMTPEDSILTEGSLPDSEIMEMDWKEIEILKLRQIVRDLEEKLSENPGDLSIGNFNDTMIFELDSFMVL
jgi:hypothetical protein